MNEVLLYIVTFLVKTASFLFVARFLLQLCRADFYNPLSQGIIKITDPVLKPLRMALPGYRNLDFAAFLAAVAAEALFLIADAALSSRGFGSLLQVFVIGLFQTLMLVIQVFWWSLLIGIIASFIAPGSYHPALALIQQITEPLLAPARRLLPPMGGLDFSPILVFLLLGVVERILPQIFQQLL